jgi:hypothetical protein
MTVTEITRGDEIVLNAQIYRITGKVIRRLVTRPRKFTIGDTLWNDDQFLSTMSISDQRNGIGVEEYLKAEHQTRCWWSTLDLTHTSHAVPQPLAVKITQPGAHDALTAPAVWCHYNNELYMANGQYLEKLEAGGAHFVNFADCTVAITDVFAAPGPYLIALAGSAHTIYYSGGTYDTTTLHLVKGIVWNDKIFVMSTTGLLYEYVVATDSLTLKGTLPDGLSPTSLFLYHDSTGAQIIYAATAEHLWAHDYANTRFIETNLKYAKQSTAGMGAVDWNTDAYVSMGLHVKRYTVGGGATSVPVGLDLDDGIPSEYQGEIVKFIDGTDCIYALVDSTKAGATYYSWIGRFDGYGWQVIWDASMLDEWVSPTGATDTGAVWSNEDHLYDNDLGTYCGTTGTVAAESWQPETDYLEATIGATTCNAVMVYATSGYTPTTNQIDVDIYYGAAWHHLYQGVFNFGVYTRNIFPFAAQSVTNARFRFYNADTTARAFAAIEVYFHKVNGLNLAMTSGIVSDVVARRLWFNAGADVYYIPLQKYNLMPKKNAAYTYAATGTHITPWYNFDSFVQTKYIDALNVFTSDLGTQNELIIARYRIDHASNDLDTGWLPLMVINAAYNGASSWPFASSVGLTCNAIQFRFDLIRGATTTLAPDLKAYGVSYQRQLNKKYSYQVRITGKDQRYTPQEIWTALNTAVATRTKMTLYYRNTAKYVQAYDFTGSEPTGDNYDGIYTLLLVEV